MTSISESLYFVSLGLCSRGTDSGQRTPDEDVCAPDANIEVQACCNHSGVTLNAPVATAIYYRTILLD